MGMISSKSIDQPDEIVSAPKVAKRIVTVGKTVIARIECQPGWRWSRDIKPTAKTASCQHHHQGIVLSGRLHVASDEGGERIIGPGDAFDILPGHDAWIPGGESCVMIEFQGARDWGKPPQSGDRVLATLMVTDIVGSTAAAARLGDAAWKALLARHYDSVRRELGSFRGIEVDTSGDGFLAMFDGAARAVRCTASIRKAAKQDGIEVRAGVHSGEVERHGEHLRGVAVHIAARIAALAQPGEILLSSSTAAILEGSGLNFSDAGEHELKGLAERRRLFRLDGAANTAQPTVPARNAGVRHQTGTRTAAALT
jgi:class 3 adenylate cyclase